MEAETLGILMRDSVNQGTESWSFAISILFSLVFGYMAALYYFIGKQGLAFKAFAFFCFSFTFIWMYLGGMSFASANWAWSEQNIRLVEEGVLNSPIERARFQQNWVFVAAIVYSVTSLIVYLGITFLTFFYPWQRAQIDS